MTIMRTYFFDLKTRKEITSFEANGKTWLGTSGYVRDENGQFIKGTCDAVTVADWASLRGVKGERRVTIEDFPGHDAIAVKIWTGPGQVEWRKLVAA